MLYRRTQSLCPICMRRIEASYEDDGSAVVLRKICPDHGLFQVPIWQKFTDFKSWSRPKIPSYPLNPQKNFNLGCPFDCGLCSEHAQHTCTGLIEVTKSCNLNCPVCYAGARENHSKDPSLSEVIKRLTALRNLAGPCNLQISGGEPTLREDLLTIIAKAKALNFGLIQLNTNGLRLAYDVDYAKALVDAGLESIYLQWDGVEESTFLKIRGRPCLDFKFKALEQAISAGLGVVLVATVIKGINDHELGQLLRLAVKKGSAVKGLHLQPAAFFGRYPYDLLKAPRLTLSEVLAAICEQASDLVKPKDFHPPICEHELCSFSAVYRRTFAGGLLLAQKASNCCGNQEAAEGSRISRQFTARHWRGSCACANAELTKNATINNQEVLDKSFESFLASSSQNEEFTLSAMAFQDALSLDIARVRGCCIHIIRADGSLMPFCLHNLTNISGLRLYPEND